jgi:hypothetical protein
MNKLAIIGMFSLCAAGAYAQGTLIFGDDGFQGYYSQIYSPNTANPTVETLGNTSSQVPAGTQTYPAGQYTPIGGQRGGGVMNYAYGNQFTVQIYWTPSTYAPSHLTAGSSFLASQVYPALLTSQPAYNPATQTGQGNGNPSPSYIGTMADGTQGQTAGFFQVNNAPSVDNGLFGEVQTQDDFNNLGTQDTAATVAVACWYNAAGTINSLAAASAAQVPYGISLPFTMGALGESSADESLFNSGNTPATASQAMSKLTSFSLIGPVPEPSTIALGVLGACAFLARRKK